eukprot:gene10605-10763_t
MHFVFRQFDVTWRHLAAMAEPATSDIAADAKDMGNPVPIILGFVVTIVVLFFVVNVGLWYYAQQNAPKVTHKKLGAKKAKREQLKRGMQVLGD